MTVLGDIAQSTGAWARDSWDDVIDLLKGQSPVLYEELELGYRVPRQIYEVAERVLPTAAANVKPPRVVRDGPSSPEILQEVDPDLQARKVVDTARGYAADGNSVGIITPSGPRDEIVELLDKLDVRWSNAAQGDLGSGINLLSPLEAKGLEFDAVIVVEPELIIAEDPRGHRLLYVALTRTTRHLTVISTGAGVPGDAQAYGLLEQEPTDGAAGDVSSLPFHDLSVVSGVAKGLAQQIRHLVTPEARQQLLDALRTELGEDESGTE
jgi:DNA helicase IV